MGVREKLDGAFGQPLMRDKHASAARGDEVIESSVRFLVALLSPPGDARCRAFPNPIDRWAATRMLK